MNVIAQNRFQFTTTEGKAYDLEWHSESRTLVAIPQSGMEEMISLIHAKRLPEGSLVINQGNVVRTFKTHSPWEFITKKSSSNAQSQDEIHSPINGKVIKVMAKESDRVEKGQILAIIEAMKMENNITAPHAGCVVSCLVQEGQSVQAGQLVIKLSDAKSE